MTACLDWSAAAHWSPKRRPCRHCGSLTNLLDGAGRPAHKVCSERVIDQLRAARANQRKEVA